MENYRQEPGPQRGKPDAENGTISIGELNIHLLHVQSISIRFVSSKMGWIWIDLWVISDTF